MTSERSLPPGIEPLEARRVLNAVVSVDVNLPHASESDPLGSGMGQFVIRRTGETTHSLNVRYYVRSDSVAEEGEDFAPLFGIRKIPPGRSYSRVNIFPIDDSKAEGDEQVKINLAPGEGYTVSQTDYLARLSIADNESLPEIRIQRARDASEIDPNGQGMGQFILWRTGPTTHSINVRYYVRSDSVAKNGQDFDVLAGVRTIPAGRAHSRVNIFPIDDALVEGDELIKINVAPDSAYTVSPTEYFTRINLADRSSLPTVSARFVRNASEIDPRGAGMGQFIVERTGPTLQPLNVRYYVRSDSIAKNGQDFEVLTGVRKIPAGRAYSRVNIFPIDDAQIEGNELIKINIAPNNAYNVSPTQYLVRLNLADNDVGSSPNHRPAAPEITEPLREEEPISAFGNHFEIGPFIDSDPGDTRRSTDWEVWTRGSNPQLAWFRHDGTADDNQTDHQIHSMMENGTFTGPLSGQTRLAHDTSYQLRVRTRDNSGNSGTEFSEWAIRNFRTLPIQTPTAAGWVAQQPGFRVEEVPFTFSAGQEAWRLPVTIAFVPPSQRGSNPLDPLFYVAELYGTIRVITNNFEVSTYADNLLNYNPGGPISGTGENGMGCITVDPATGDVWATMLYDDSSDSSTDTFGKVVRFTSNDGGLTAATQTDILTMPGYPMRQSHFISNITIGPEDQKVYVHVGDGFAEGVQQNLGDFRGKILRMNKDGSPVSDNPFRVDNSRTNPRNYIYARGFRNPFGGVWRDATNNRPAQHWIAENGPNRDRLSVLVEGRNYLFNGTNESMVNFNIAYSPSGTFENGTPDWDPPVAPVELTFLQASTSPNFSNFPADKRGHLFVALSGPTHAQGPNDAKAIQEWIINDDGTRYVPGPGEPANPRILASYEGPGFSTVAGVAFGPDGLYFTTLYPDADQNPLNRGAQIYRIVYNGE